MPKEPITITTLRLRSSLYERLRAFAAQENRSIAGQIEHVLDKNVPEPARKPKTAKP